MLDAGLAAASELRQMRLTVIGIGYLGLTHAVCMAELGTDGSQRLAVAADASAAPGSELAYGNALLGDTNVTPGRYVIRADADDSYDSTGLIPFLYKLRADADLVMGNRFTGGMALGGAREILQGRAFESLGCRQRHGARWRHDCHESLANLRMN